MPLNTPTMVVVAHENAVIAAGLRCILKTQPGFEVEAWDRDRRLGREDPPDLLVADHATALQWVGQDEGGCRSARNILVVPMGGDDADVRRAFELGIHGYVILDCPAEEIAGAARAVRTLP